MTGWIMNREFERTYMVASGVGLVWNIIPVFAGRDWRNAWNTLVRFAGLKVEFWTRDLQKKKLKRQLRGRDFRCHLVAVFASAPRSEHCMTSSSSYLSGPL